MSRSQLEADGTGFRCRRCGITVLGTVPPKESDRLCGSCRPLPPKVHVEDVFALVEQHNTAMKQAIFSSHAKTGSSMKARTDAVQAETKRAWLALGLPDLDWSERDD
jgi:hypothetical protein